MASRCLEFGHVQQTGKMSTTISFDLSFQTRAHHRASAAWQRHNSLKDPRPKRGHYGD